MKRPRVTVGPKTGPRSTGSWRAATRPMVPSGSSLVGSPTARLSGADRPRGYGAENSSTGGDPIGVELVGTADGEARCWTSGSPSKQATGSRLDGPDVHDHGRQVRKVLGGRERGRAETWRCVAGNPSSSPTTATPENRRALRRPAAAIRWASPTGPDTRSPTPTDTGGPGLSVGSGHHRPL